MTRLEKILLAIDNGFTYNELTGVVKNSRGMPVKKRMNGYIVIGLYVDKKYYNLCAHQFGYYVSKGKIVKFLDHKNGIRHDNWIDNLREVTHQENHYNRTTAKGYYFHKVRKKFIARIVFEGKQIDLGEHD